MFNKPGVNKVYSLCRPIHDAVEYDNVEMTRLLLACGADPILSKFSGRGIREMIRGSVMKEFLTGKKKNAFLLSFIYSF